MEDEGNAQKGTETKKREGGRSEGGNEGMPEEKIKRNELLKSCRYLDGKVKMGEEPNEVKIKEGSLGYGREKEVKIDYPGQCCTSKAFCFL